MAFHLIVRCVRKKETRYDKKTDTMQYEEQLALSAFQIDGVLIRPCHYLPAPPR